MGTSVKHVLPASEGLHRRYLPLTAGKRGATHQYANRCMPMTEADIIEPRNRTASDGSDVAWPLLSLAVTRNAMMNVAIKIRIAMM